MQYTIQMEEESVVVDLSGNLTVENAAALKEVLMSALSRSQRIIVNLEHVEDADLSGLQLLCSAHRISTHLNKNVALAGPCSETFMEALETAGFLRHDGCSLDTQKTCLWKRA
ncbi:MAG: STAS domain-containing protein [Nitrospirae bacterium]|nr:STAS domain-containing protein [Nitrospirota bacterium]